MGGHLITKETPDDELPYGWSWDDKIEARTVNALGTRARVHQRGLRHISGLAIIPNVVGKLGENLIEGRSWRIMHLATGTGLSALLAGPDALDRGVKITESLARIRNDWSSPVPADYASNLAAMKEILAEVGAYDTPEYKAAKPDNYDSALNGITPPRDD